MKPFARLLREPLLHFALIGGLVFAVHAIVDEPREPLAEVIVVGPERIAQLVAGFDSVWGRPPKDDEIRAIVDDFVREKSTTARRWRSDWTATTRSSGGACVRRWVS